MVGLVSLVIVSLVSLVTVGRISPSGLVVGLVVGFSLLSLIVGFALLGLDGLAAWLVFGLVLLALLALLGLFLSLAIGLVVVRIVEDEDAHNINDVWQSGSGLPQMRSLAWARRLLPPHEGAAWWTEVVSTLAETQDVDQQRAYLRGYRRGLLKLLWTSWVLYLSSARRRNVS